MVVGRFWKEIVSHKRIMSTNHLMKEKRRSEFMDGIHYKVIEKGGDGYYFCMSCQRYFLRVYKPKIVRYHHTYGTRQLMALWAWYNFERHLKRCIA